jgi:hypothetical protein
MKIDIRPIAEIKPYPNNPRINDDAVDAVANACAQGAGCRMKTHRWGTFWPRCEASMKGAWHE